MKKTLLAIAVALAISVTAGLAWAVGFNDGLTLLDNALGLVRNNEQDAAKQAALDAIRAKLASPKIDSVADNVAALSVALRSCQKTYGTIEAFEAKSVIKLPQLENSVSFQVVNLSNQARTVVEQYALTPAKKTKLEKKVNGLVAKYDKAQLLTDRFKRLKADATAAKAYAAFIRKFDQS